MGGIFNTINPSVYESRSNPVEPKAVYSRKDLKDWCKIRKININWPDIFPVNSVKAMRGVFFALAIFVLEFAVFFFMLASPEEFAGF